MNKAIIFGIILWQVITVILIGGGIYVDLFRMFGISWNTTGWLNIFGTVVGFILLEIPALALIVWFFFRKNAGTA